MGEAVRAGELRVVGREPELARLRTFVASDGGALVLTGEPGAGKTTLWEAGIEIARERGLRPLASRPSDAEIGLSYAGLADLLAGIEIDALAGMPGPQRRALEIALLRVTPEAEPPDAFAISAGFLSSLRALSEHERVLVAVDDLQWLDPPSAEALAFAARRLRDRPVRFLLARRSGPTTGLEHALEPAIDSVEVAPLDAGGARELLAERLGLRLPRQTLGRVHEAAQGNPLLVLELGRMLGDGPPDTAELPLPRAAEELFGARIAVASPDVRRAVLAVALAGELTLTQLEAVADADTVDDAADVALLVLDGERVRTSHPLLAATARAGATARERRALHLALAGVVDDETVLTRHLALAAARPDAELADRVATAAALALQRGAPADAVELAEHALRLTPPASEARGERILALGQCLEVAGDMERLTAVLSPRLDELAPPHRARAHLLLGEAADVVEVSEAHLDQAFADSEGDPALRATVLAKRAFFWAVERIERLPEAEAWAVDALELARTAGHGAERSALHALIVTRIIRGRPIEELAAELRSASSDSSLYAGAIELPVAIRLMLRGEVADARESFRGLLEVADERGEARSYSIVQLHLCELELRAGLTQAAAALLEESDEWSSVMGRQGQARRAWCRALLAGITGDAAEAGRWLAEADEATESTGSRGDLLDGLRARGLAALAGGHGERAVESLRAVWGHAEREGVDDPGVFPVGPDLVETLVELGEADEAQAVTQRLAALAEEQDHPWGLASAARSRGVLQLAAKAHDEAAAELTEAATRYEALGLRFDQARTLLALGRGERRLKKWGAARRTLERAVAVFEENGATGWAETAGSELARVAARRPTTAGALTPAEERVARLAANGLSNKEIAAALFISVYTVERHLGRAYAKLGVRSRGQLGQRLPG